MFGYRRACKNASGSIELATTCALACARTAFSAVSNCLNRGTELIYIGLVMGSLGNVCVQRSHSLPQVENDGFRNAGWGGCPGTLLDAITAGGKTRYLGTIVIGEVAAHRPAPRRSRIISELRDRPAIAFVFVNALLILALIIYRIDL